MTYALHVFFPGNVHARHVEYLEDASQVLTRIATLLEEHHGCETVVVFAGANRLFSVDCKGNTTPG